MDIFGQPGKPAAIVEIECDQGAKVDDIGGKGGDVEAIAEEEGLQRLHAADGLRQRCEPLAQGEVKGLERWEVRAKGGRQLREPRADAKVEHLELGQLADGLGEGG